MTFEREERIAFARIISDLIEADFIVDANEMKFLDELKERKDFKITDDMLSKAKRMSFATAVNILQKIKEPDKKALIKSELYKMSLSDGNCVPLEALQIMAVKYALEGKGQVFSIPSGSSFVENMKVLYIENDDNTVTDAYVRANYRAISNEFRLAGFDFVYIPQIVEDFRQINGKYLHKVITYIMPKIEEQRVQSIQHDLCSMTTSRFTQELLYKKMGINMLSSKPAFLIKIGESSVADKSGTDDMERDMHSNFLLVPIEEIGNSEGMSILDHVVALIDSYLSMVSENLIIETRPLSKKFLYYGFHRSLFDLIAYGKEKADYKLIININNKTNPVVLRPIDANPHFVEDCEDDLPIDLNTQPYTLYILMVLMSLTGEGLDWSAYAPKNPERLAILEKYNVIYKAIGKGNSNTDYRDKTHVSRIKKSLRIHDRVVTNIDLFIPEKIMIQDNEYYNVPIPSSLVYVVEDGKEIRLVDSDFWKNL